MPSIEQCKSKLEARERDGIRTNPLDIPNTGHEVCKVCDHGRSAFDGNGVCLLCTLYLFLKDGGEVMVVR